MNRWPINKAYFWEIVPFFRILLPFAAGIFCYYQRWLNTIPSAYFIYIAVVSLALLGVLAIGRKTPGIVSPLIFVLANIILFSCGISISAYNDIRNDAAWFGKSIRAKNTYLARIISTPDEKENSWKLSVNVLNSVDAGSAKAATGKAFVYVQKDSLPMRLQRGDTILLPGKWLPMKDAGNPFEFSYATYCARNNILYRQWCASKDVQLYGARNPAALPLTEVTHDWCMRALEKYLGKHKSMGLLQAMLLGDEVNLDEDLRRSYSDTGIVHIIAISGGNVSIFFMVIAFLLGWIKHKKHNWIKYALALPIIWFYVLMAGAQPSAVRAAMLFSLLAVGIMFQKNNNGINHLFATAFVLLCAEPAWLFSVGFQLSFVAVLSIMLFYKPVYSWLQIPVIQAKGKGISKKILQWIYSIPRALWGAVAMSIAAEILVAPLVAYYFHTFPVMFIVANVAAFMFMGIVLVLGMLLVTVSALPILANNIAAVVKWLVDVFGKIVEQMQGAGPESFNYLMLSGYEILLLYIFIAGITWFLMLQNKRALFAGLFASCLLLASLCIGEWGRLQQHRLVVYNTAHINHIEVMQGSHYSTLHTDTAFAEQVDYATRPAHIGWRAWKEQPANEKEFFSVGGRTALILDNDLSGTAPFHVDYLILNGGDKINIPSLLQIFSPSLIVAGNNYSKKAQIQIAAACDSLGVAVHLVTVKGAFVLSN